MKILKGSFLAILAIFLTSTISAFVWGIGNSFWAVTTIGVAYFSAMVALCFMVLWGIPIHFILRKLTMSSIGWYLAAGFLPGPVFVFTLKPLGHDPIFYLSIQSAYCGVVGMVGAACFWFYVVRKTS